MDGNGWEWLEVNVGCWRCGKMMAGFWGDGGSIAECRKNPVEQHPGHSDL